MFLRWKWIEETSCHALLCFERSCHLKFCFYPRKKRETIWSLFSTSEERPLFHVRIPVFLAGLFWSSVLHILNYTPMIYCYTINYSCWHVNTWSGSGSRSLPLPYSQSPVCSVKQWQSAVQFWSRGPEQTAVSCCLPWFTVNISCALNLVLNRSWGNPIIACHTLHSGDCGWYHSEISVASTVQAVSLQRPSWTTGLICLYHTLPSYDLIWLNVWLREEDWPKPQLGILFAPVFVFSSDWTLSEEMSEEVFAVLKLYSIFTWALLRHGK